MGQVEALTGRDSCSSLSVSAITTVRRSARRRDSCSSLSVSPHEVNRRSYIVSFGVRFLCCYRHYGALSCVVYGIAAGTWTEMNSCPYMVLFQVHLPCQQSCLIAADPRTEMNGCPYS
jgi:hypothetical protein